MEEMERQFKKIAPLLRTLWAELRKGRGTLLFCQTQDQEGLAESFLKQFQNFDSDVEPTVFHYSFPGYNPRPYAPFLDLCREQIAGAGVDEILGKFNEISVYDYHKDILAEYLANGMASRKEHLLPGELDYESFQMQLSIWNIIAHLLGDKPVLFFVENSHYLPRSTLRLLKMVLKNKIEVPFLCILSAPEVVQDITEAEISPWTRLLEIADQNRLVLNCHGSRDQVLFNEVIQKDRQILDNPQFYDGINAYNLLALEDSERIFQSFIDVQLYNMALPDIRYQVWKYLGLIQYYRANYEAAVQHFENGLSIAQQLNSSRIISEACYLLGSAYLGLGNCGFATELSERAVKSARESKDKLSLFNALFLQMQFDEGANRKNISRTHKDHSRAEQLALELGLENSYIFLASSPRSIWQAMREEDFDETGFPPVILAKKRNNLRRLSIIYHSLGSAYIDAGKYELVLKYYNKSKKLKLALPDNQEAAATYNGTGYYHFFTGDYGKAFSNFKLAMELLRSGTAYQEISMTLYNLGLYGFLSRHFEAGAEYCDNCLNIMKTLSIDELSLHGRTAVLVLMGLNLIKSGNMVRAWQIRMQIELEKPAKNGEDFFTSFFLALHNRELGEYAEADCYFQKAHGALTAEKNPVVFLFPAFLLEYGDFKLLCNKREEASSWFMEGMEYALEMGNEYYRDLLSRRIKNFQIHEGEACGRHTMVDFKWALHGARMQNNLNLLRKRLQDINQLNMLFGLIAEETSCSDLVQKVMDLLYSHFEVDFDVLMYFSRHHNEFQQMYIREKTGIRKNEEFTRLIQRLAEEENAIRFFPFSALRSFSRVMENFGGVLCIKINPKSKTSGMILCFSRKGETSIRSESLQLISLIGQQFGLALEKLHQQQTIVLQNEELRNKNDLLKKSSTTDYLTNLGNRAALYAALEHEISRLDRYGSGGAKHIALLFIDLDNFKFFNDTYGHAAGDNLLIQISRTIKSAVRTIDLAFRYGGDEFVVILPETEEKGAGELGQRIIRAIEERDSYRKELEEVVSRPIIVPEDKRLSCSIGIAATNRLGTSKVDIDSFLNLADKALYQAKLLGKHRIYLA